MIGRLVRAGAPAAIGATLVLGLVLLFRPVAPGVALDGYVLVLGGIALLGLVGTTAETEAGPKRSTYDQAVAPRTVAPERPLELSRIEREVALGVDTAFYAHYRLRPLLRLVAEDRLERRFGSSLETAAGEARASLPDDAWELFDPERPPPRNPHGPGVPRERLEAIVEALERMQR